METAYFRFAQTNDRDKLYSTLSLSLLANTLLFSILIFLIRDKIIGVAGLEDHPQFVTWMLWIIVIDNLTTLPFARLRQENRPKKYAFARIAGIIINISTVIFFLGILPKYLSSHPDSTLQLIYNESLGIGYYMIGNIAGSLFTLLILLSEIKKIRFSFDSSLWKEAIRFSTPMIIVGLGGMANDLMSRLIYRHVVDLPEQQADHELGVFANIFRIAMVITIAIQAFRMAAEPFFFNKSREENVKKVYARVMKFFVIACCFLFLATSLFLDVFRMIFDNFANSTWSEGLGVVPWLALGNIFLGIYYNISIWYKLTDKTMTGAMITLLGAIITIALNVLLIPIWHYTGAALATFCCYFVMMIVSYKLGQKHYPVPYATKKLSAYIIICILLYLLHLGLTGVLSDSLLFSVASGMTIFAFFAWFISKTEAKELAKWNSNRKSSAPETTL
jgi:O-antigen/teichoic acid export membrane protein